MLETRRWEIAVLVVKGDGKLGNRLLALHRFQRHLGLESPTVLPPSFRYFLLLPDRNICPQFRSRTLTWLPVLLSGSTSLRSWGELAA